MDFTKFIDDIKKGYQTSPLDAFLNGKFSEVGPRLQANAMKNPTIRALADPEFQKTPEGSDAIVNLAIGATMGGKGHGKGLGNNPQAFNTSVDTLTRKLTPSSEAVGAHSGGFAKVKALLPKDFNIGAKQQELQKPILTMIEQAINSGNFAKARELVNKMPINDARQGMESLLKGLGY